MFEREREGLKGKDLEAEQTGTLKVMICAGNGQMDDLRVMAFMK